MRHNGRQHFFPFHLVEAVDRIRARCCQTWVTLQCGLQGSLLGLAAFLAAHRELRRTCDARDVRFDAHEGAFAFETD